MILYIPTTDSDGLCQLINKHGDNYLDENIKYYLLQQIHEQTPKKATSVSLDDIIDKKIKIALENNKL